LKRVFQDDDHQKDETVTVPAVSSEPATISSEHQNLSCSVAEDTIAAESTSSSSVKDATPVNCCTAVVSRSSFSIMRLLSLSDDNSSCEDVKTGPDAGDDDRKLSKSLSAVGHSPIESVASQDQSARAGGVKDSASLGSAEVKPVPVHFKKRMLSTATVSQSSSSFLSEPSVIGKSVTPRHSFTIHEDSTSATSTPPAKVGIVISHGRAMTLQDKLQMTASAARRSPTSSGRSLSIVSTASPLRALNRHVTPVASHCKLKRRSKPVVKRSLIPSPKVRYIPYVLSLHVAVRLTTYCTRQ